VTTAAAVELGITSTITADTFDVDGLVEALVRRFAHSSK
jgi:uroporphyrinogen-III synthase